MDDRLHRTQLTMPPDRKKGARACHTGVLEMGEIEKPAMLATRGGVRFRASSVFRSTVLCGKVSR